MLRGVTFLKWLRVTDSQTVLSNVKSLIRLRLGNLSLWILLDRSILHPRHDLHIQNCLNIGHVFDFSACPDQNNDSVIRLQVVTWSNIPFRLDSEPSISHTQWDHGAVIPMNSTLLSDYALSTSDSADSDYIIHKIWHHVNSCDSSNRTIKSTKHPEFVYELHLVHCLGLTEHPPSDEPRVDE